MEDFRKLTIIDKNFSIENTITENNSIRSKNTILALIGISAGIIMIGIAFYLAQDEYKRKFDVVRESS